MLKEIEQRTVELRGNICRLVHGVAASRPRHPNLALPSLILPTGGSVYAFRSIRYTLKPSPEWCVVVTKASDHFVGHNLMTLGPALPPSSSSPGEQNPRPLDGSIWPIIPRVRHQSNRDVSDMVDRVTEASEDA